MIEILHNPRCGKSREAVAFLQESGKDFHVIKYLDDVLTFDELNIIIKKLGIQPIELVRQKEKIWIENFKGKELSDNKIIEAMILNPILIERPIVIINEKAVIARPYQKIGSIL